MTSVSPLIFVLVVFVLICGSIVFGQSETTMSLSPPQKKESPTQNLLRILQNAGCTNMLAARYVIDAYSSGIAASVVVDRLSEVVPVTVKQVSHW